MTDCSARDGYLDQTLGAQERAAFEGHAASCAACRSAIAQWKNFGASLQAVYAPLHQAPPPGEVARLKSKASEDRSTRRPLGPGRR